MDNGIIPYTGRVVSQHGHGCPQNSPVCARSHNPDDTLDVTLAYIRSTLYSLGKKRNSMLSGLITWIVQVDCLVPPPPNHRLAV